MRDVASINNSNSTISRNYYNDNLLYTETNKYSDNINRTVTYSYDPDGRRASLTYPISAYTFAYTYTKRSQLDLIQSGGATVADYDYDVNGNMSNRTLDNSTSSGFDYDAVNRMTVVRHWLVGATRAFDYVYDTPKIGNLGWVMRDTANGGVFLDVQRS